MRWSFSPLIRGDTCWGNPPVSVCARPLVTPAVGASRCRDPTVELTGFLLFPHLGFTVALRRLDTFGYCSARKTEQDRVEGPFTGDPRLRSESGSANGPDAACLFPTRLPHHPTPERGFSHLRNTFGLRWRPASIPG